MSFQSTMFPDLATHWSNNLKSSQTHRKHRKVKYIIENPTLVFGARPVANIICEKPSAVPLLVFKDNEPSADLMIAWGDSSI